MVICLKWEKLSWVVSKIQEREFDVEDKERSERPKVYEDAKLEALLDEDSCQT